MGPLGRSSDFRETEPPLAPRPSKQGGSRENHSSQLAHSSPAKCLQRPSPAGSQRPKEPPGVQITQDAGENGARAEDYCKREITDIMAHLSHVTASPDVGTPN